MDIINSDGYTLYIEIALIVLLLILELIYSVSLAVVDYLTDADIEEIKSKISTRDLNKLTAFADDKFKYENRFHAALITINIVMFEPLRFFALFLKNLISSYFENIPIYAFVIGFLFAFIIFLFFNYMLFFSLPRRIIRHSSELRVAKLTLASIKFSVVFIPFADFTDYLIKKFFKAIGKNKYNDVEEVTEEDILSLVQESQDQGILEEDEAEMINNIFELNDKEAKDIMTNRNSIIGINGNTPLPEAIEIMLEANITRFPVYLDNLDHIIGILTLKDALRYSNENKSRTGAVKRYPKILREARYVSETRKIDDLFHKMQADKLQMVIVIDEYGQTSGLVAMEDIVEEIVGNILDEFDEEETFIEIKGEKTFEIDGLTPLEELDEKFSIDFEKDDIETLNGFLIDKIGHIPKEDDKIYVEFKGYSFEAALIENHIIKSVIMKQIVENDDSDSNENGIKTQDVENNTEK